MSTVFKGAVSPAPDIKRNTFDLSFQNNLTCQIGKLYPVFCKEVVPGDSFRIKTTFGFQFMPLVFPLQTKMRATVHFFYVRNRNLWKDWPDFISKTDGSLSGKSHISAFPTLSVPSDDVQYKAKFGTRSLSDYLGLPTASYDASLGKDNSITCDLVSGTGAGTSQFLQMPWILGRPFNYTDFNSFGQLENEVFNILQPGVSMGSTNIRKPPFSAVPGYPYDKSSTDYNRSSIIGLFPIRLSDFSVISGKKIRITIPVHYTIDPKDLLDESDMFLLSVIDGIKIKINSLDSKYTKTTDGNNVIYEIALPLLSVSDENLEPSYMLALGVPCIPFEYNNTAKGIYACDMLRARYSDKVYISFPDGAVLPDTSEVTVKNTPLKDLPPSALPFRAYEAIYNSFYRNPENNPYIKDGHAEYNKFIPSDDGGVDTNEYILHNRNWESDFLTTAVQDPTMGITPLVGISSTGVATFSDADGNEYKAQLETDGKDKITSFSVQETSVPNSVMRSLVDLASSGISISDLRDVNGLQRWLEVNMRRGLSYKDQILNHFGVDTRFDVMQYPEFIGGISRPVQIAQINQTTPTDSSPLGSYAGQAYCVGESGQVQKYCDEHGFIIGILSICPTPVYSQLYPKMFRKLDALDYYFPEFGHISMQAIKYAEVCPVLAKETGTDFNTVYGYQRAWYEYLQSVDECHGDFRKSLRDYLFMRIFTGLPKLTPSFLTVDQSQLNNPFANTETNYEDNIIGQLDFDVTAKRPIPRYGVPRLE